MYAARILVLSPHPDDEVVGCAAAVSRVRAAGAAVFCLYLTTGVPGPEAAWRPDAARHAARVAVRRAEAERSAARLGLTPVDFLPHASRTLRHAMPAALAAVRDAVRRTGATAVWAPAYEGGHQDHDVTNALASRLPPSVAVWEYAEYNRAGGRVNSQRFPDRRGGEVELALTDTERREKRALLDLYASEAANLAHIRDEREMLRPLPAHDYTRPPHAGTLFHARFRWVPIPHPRVDFTDPAEVRRAIVAFVTDERGAGRALDAVQHDPS